MSQPPIPVITPAGFSRLPLWIVLGYVGLTFVLFLLWPIKWPIYALGDWVRLSGYVLICLTGLSAAMIAGSAGFTPVVERMPGLNLLLIAGCVLAGLLLIPSSYTYTGHAPWQVLEMLRDQGGAYRRLQSQLLSTDGQRTTLALARAFIAPLTYAVVPLGMIRWSRLGWAMRLSVVATALFSLIFSIMRGTDKEIADLLITGCAAWAVALGRRRAQGASVTRLLRETWMTGVALMVFVVLAQGLFTTRKDERLGGFANRTVVCANNSGICADLDTPALAFLPLRQRFGLSIFILSTCSGYYGLELAMEKPFQTAWGTGHSPASLSVYELLTGDTAPHHDTYTWRNNRDGWPEEYYWSTLMTWLANDVGFAGAIPLLALLGWAWGLWWREAAAGFSDPAAVLFTLATTAIVYLPANNQVLASYDGYSEIAVWLTIWWWHRSRYRLGFRL